VVKPQEQGQGDILQNKKRKADVSISNKKSKKPKKSKRTLHGDA